MKTPITYYGGKQMLAKIIIDLIPPHEHYIEPFFGGGAVFFAKPPSKFETINDINDNVVNFYKVLKNNFNELKKLVDSSLFSESQLKYARQILKNPNGQSNIERAWAFWYATNLSMGGDLTNFFCHNGKRNTPISLNNKKKNFIFKYAQRLEKTQIFCRDAIDVIKKMDSPNTFFYCDPPYINADKGHYDNYYLNDFINLLNTLANIKGKFLLSSYPEPILNEYKQKYKWHYREIKLPKPSKIINKYSKNKNKNPKIECLTWNYSPPNKLFNEIYQSI